MKEIILNNNIKLLDKQNIGNITKYKFSYNYIKEIREKH